MFPLHHGVVDNLWITFFDAIERLQLIDLIVVLDGGGEGARFQSDY